MQGIIDRKLIAPVEVNIDPINSCTLKCQWCNAKRVLDGKKISKDVMIKLLDDLANWGTLGICFAGGGEPSLHPEIDLFVKHCTKLGLESAMITNGYSWTTKLVETIADHMRWVGISVDASTRGTFLKLKKVDGFTKTLKNIYNLVYYKEMDKKNCKVGITFKFLIHPENQHEIYDACKIAKDLRCDSFHLRPVDFLAYKNEEEKLDLKLINEQIKKCHELSDDNFEFIPFFACFDNNLVSLKFDKCELAPLLGICLPSGWWLCIDRKGQKGLRLCGIDEIREFWGSEKHFEIMDSINPKRDCGKCTLSKYYENFISYKNDDWYWKFV